MVSVGNWAHTLRFRPQRVVDDLEDVAALRDVVTEAVRSGQRVRTVGSLYSFSDCIVSRELLVHPRRVGHRIRDVRVTRKGARDALGRLLHPDVFDGAGCTGFAWVLPGTRIHAMVRALARRNMAPYVLGGSTGQRVLGAVSTSTHGAAFDEGPLPDSVVALHVLAGDRDVFIEPARFRVTRDEAARHALCGTNDVELVRSDAALAAAAVAVGAGGVLAGALVKARWGGVLNERVKIADWATVRQALISASQFDAPPGEDPWDGPLGTYRALEVMIDAYARPPRAFLVIRTEGWSGFREDRDLRRGPVDIVAFAKRAGRSRPQLSKALRLLVEGSRVHGSESRRNGRWIWHDYAKLIDTGVPTSQRVFSHELVWREDLRSDGNTADYVRFLDRAVELVQQSVEDGDPYLGMISLRFSRGTSAFLGMQWDPNPDAVRFAHVELSPIQRVGERRPTGAMPIANVNFIERLLSHETAATARPHWGQASGGRAVFDARRYPRLSQWKRQIRRILGPHAGMFSNEFNEASHTAP
ncbi:MAG TPA: hypothetical protein RMG48_01705 [Myxococcales bacterium LLY-WYZ-16_1]|nr:hypothetical protein [Myxococcales bacterium LLY-WYZ-16_1]